MSARPGPAGPRRARRGAERRLAARRERRRRIGAGLLGFGLAGLVVLAGTAAIIIGTLGPLETAAREIERQRVELEALLDSSSDTLERAGSGASNAGLSLRESAAAAREGAALTADLAIAFDQLAAISAVNVFGTRPFAELGAGFATVAARARTLSGNLAGTATALAANEVDATRMADDLRELARQLDDLRTGIVAEAPPSSSDAPPTAEAFEAVALVRIVLLGLLAWLALPALAAAWIGWCWVRGERALRS